MALSVSINGEARVFRLFDLVDLFHEMDVDVSQVDLS